MSKKVSEKELSIMKFREQPTVITKVVYRDNPNLWIYLIIALMTGVLLTLGTQNLLTIL